MDFVISEFRQTARNSNAPDNSPDLAAHSHGSLQLVFIGFAITALAVVVVVADLQIK